MLTGYVSFRFYHHGDDLFLDDRLGRSNKGCGSSLRFQFYSVLLGQINCFWTHCEVVQTRAAILTVVIFLRLLVDLLSGRALCVFFPLWGSATVGGLWRCLSFNFTSANRQLKELS